MPSFEFADCPTRLDLAVAADGGVQAGSLRCTLRNGSNRRQTARVRIEPLAGSRPEWFSLAGAPATSPLEIEEDIEANGTLTVEVAVKIQPQPQSGSHSFRLRVTSESAPDSDFAEGPAVAFEVAAAKPREPTPPKFPWWAIAVAAALFLVVAGAVAFLFWPKGLDAQLVVGKPLAEAREIATAHGFPDLAHAPGGAFGYDPAQQVVVDIGKDAAGATVLLIDPGVAVPSIERSTLADAARALIAIGLLPDVQPTFDRRTDFADGVVTRTIPTSATPVALGSSVIIVLNDKPGGGGRPPCRNRPFCLQDMLAHPADHSVLSDTFRRRLELRKRQF